MSSSLPHSGDEAALRALDRKCADPNSIVSKRIVKQLSAESLDYKETFMYNSTIAGLGNLVRCALKAQVSPDMTEATCSAPMLALAAAHCATPSLKPLLAGGASIELADKNGQTALCWAAKMGHLSCLQFLLDAGANADAQDSLGNTPLMNAVAKKQVESARVLLPASDLALTDLGGTTAFHTAVHTGSEACFELLLPLYDVDVCTVPGVDARTGEAVSSFNETALHLACQKGLLPICKALLSRGADRMARDSRQFTPLHYAATGGHLSSVVMLVGRPGKVRMTPAEVDAANDNGGTALHVAALQGFDQICGVLIAAGARLTAKTSDGDTPLTLARKFHRTKKGLRVLLSGAGPPGLVCDNCGETADQGSVKGLKSCGKCYAARYCSKECQLAAWPEHKAECKTRVEKLEKGTRVTVLES